MSILIPGLSLPQKGKVKMLVLFDDGVLLDNEDGQNQWMAIELPPHGRLGDLDALFLAMFQCTDGSIIGDTKNGRSMYCPEEADHIANDEIKTDYISRQWLLNEYDKRHKGPPGGARKMIEEAPAAAVRPVVYCRECIYNNKCFTQSFVESESIKSFDRNTFFCADGERREGGTP